MSVEEICAITKYDPWFVRQLEEIVEDGKSQGERKMLNGTG